MNEKPYNKATENKTNSKLEVTISINQISAQNQLNQCGLTSIKELIRHKLILRNVIINYSVII